MFTKEQIEKAKECRSVEKLISFEKENEIVLTEKVAEQLFAQLNKSRELSDEEVEKAVEGYDYFCTDIEFKCPVCGWEWMSQYSGSLTDIGVESYIMERMQVIHDYQRECKAKVISICIENVCMQSD